MKKPLFVAISDIHFTLQTLSLATTALIAAIDKASELDVPLIDCGDITNDKAILRAEVVNELIRIFEYAKSKEVETFCLVGNHSLLNEKDNSKHSLNFLRDLTRLVDAPFTTTFKGKNILLLPYDHDTQNLKRYMNLPADFVVMHQGVNGAFMGDYIQDKSSIDPHSFGDRKVFSGHYHKHQTVGPVTYIGNPYTLTFGEANDGPKGFLVVYNDGTFEQIPTNLRRHLVIKSDVRSLNFETFNKDDLVWLKLKGTRSELASLSKSMIAERLGIQNFKLDKIAIDNSEAKPINSKLSEKEIFDKIIDNTAESDLKKKDLKKLWREVMS
jgi:DNA repair exonuclease SbcCD nuclease subunit